MKKINLRERLKNVRSAKLGADLGTLLIREAAPTIIRPVKYKLVKRKEKLTLIAGDAQIPFQDDRAIERFLAEVKKEQPDNVVFLGDMLDLPSLSRFAQRPEWQHNTQSAIDTYHQILARTRANAPRAKIYVVHGNHEQRLDNYIQNNAAQVMGLRRAQRPNELTVLSIPNLARYADIGVEYIDGYPNGTLWLEDNIKCIHGTNVAKGGSNAAKYLREERETTFFGHTHRLEIAYRTFPQRKGSVTIAAASPGCLAMTDGTVPGFRHTYDSQGNVVRRSEDWQQGLIKLYHTPTDHRIETIRFIELEQK